MVRKVINNKNTLIQFINTNKDSSFELGLSNGNTVRIDSSITINFDDDYLYFTKENLKHLIKLDEIITIKCYPRGE